MNISTEIPRQSLATLSQQLAYHAVTTDYGAIPEPVKDAAKLNMLDTRAVSWAGSDAPGCREAYELLVDEGGRTDGTAWAYGKCLPISAAAFINGMSSAVLDYDALGRDSPDWAAYFRDHSCFRAGTALSYSPA